MTVTGRASAVVLFLVLTVCFRVEGQLDEQDATAVKAFLTGVWGNGSYHDSIDLCSESQENVRCTDGRISSIDLSDFNLTGQIPDNTLSTLTALNELKLAGNMLTGDLSELSPLIVLQSLVLAKNNFSGAFPNAITNLSQLQELNISGNAFEGLVLQSVVSLQQLKILDLSDNMFTGDISELFVVPRNWEIISLSGNNFTGSIPDGFCDSSALTTLQLGSNKLTGPIPIITDNQKCRSLQTLDLSFNSLNGSIPDWIFLAPALKVLNLHSNIISGNLRISNGAVGSLEEINLESNRLDGEIPTLLLEFQKLVILNLGNNNFSGSLPLAFLPTTKGKSLQELDLHNNSLEGALPEFREGLLKLDFSSNLFIRNLSTLPQGLQVLDMHDNRLSEFLESFSDLDSLKYLDLSSNLFTGDFPSNFSGFSNLTRLALADNNFSIHSFPILGLLQLEVLNLSRTNLNGTIPLAIGELSGTIRHIDLSWNGLTGEIPAEMSTLTELVTLDLSDNRLEGAIPTGMISLTDLSSLNLSNNNLSGKIPEDNQWLTFPKNAFLGNSELCGVQLNISCQDVGSPGTNDGADGSTSKNTALIIGLVTGFGVLLIVVLCLFIWCRVSKAVKPIVKDESTSRNVLVPVFLEKDPQTWAKGIKDPHSIPVVIFEKPLLSLTFADLLQATANFNKELQIADGGYGPVYKAILTDGTQFAIKVLVEVKFTDGRDAMARIEALANVKHPNLVALAGFCLVGDDSLLIYEYMVNGDLQRWLHELPEGTRNPEDWSRDTWEHMEGEEMSGDFLNWPTRHKIALGAARALAFLHHGCSPHVVHQDVKSSNILLDESFEAHLVDCGLASIAKPTTTPVIGGTVGYVPPEYGQTWQATPRGDVYSFGVVLLELVTGRKPTGHYFHDSGGGNLVGWIRLSIKDKRGQKALDPKLASHGDVNQMLEVLRIGYLCTAESPAKRPTMQQVVGLLKDCQPGP